VVGSARRGRRCDPLRQGPPCRQPPDRRPPYDERFPAPRQTTPWPRPAAERWPPADGESCRPRCPGCCVRSTPPWSQAPPGSTPAAGDDPAPADRTLPTPPPSTTPPADRPLARNVKTCRRLRQPNTSGRTSPPTAGTCFARAGRRIRGATPDRALSIEDNGSYPAVASREGGPKQPQLRATPPLSPPRREGRRSAGNCDVPRAVVRDDRAHVGDAVAAATSMGTFVRATAGSPGPMSVRRLPETLRWDGQGREMPTFGWARGGWAAVPPFPDHPLRAWIPTTSWSASGSFATFRLPG
jgi:hypothetical protein